jgi:hypothetical protein
MTASFKVGDRVGAKAAVREQYERFGNTGPLYGHVVNVEAQSLVWVRDHLGGEWGLPARELEHID